nr:MAG TPA: hypothetical protein [Caudoviricetes sp.]
MHQKIHIIISIHRWIAPPDIDIVSHVLNKSNR